MKKIDPEKIIGDYFRRVKKICGANLRAFIVTGSVSKKDFLPGWSDIDAIVVLDELLPEQLIAIGDAGEVGVTAVKAEHFSAKEMTPKAKYGLSLNNHRVLYADLKIPKIKMAEISDDYKTLLKMYYDLLLKRATRGASPQSAKKAIKILFIMLKVIGREHGRNLKSYGECVAFARRLGLAQAEAFAGFDQARRRWQKIGDHRKILAAALSAGNELYSYGRKLF